jgi:hypothetical protein
VVAAFGLEFGLAAFVGRGLSDVPGDVRLRTILGLIFFAAINLSCVVLISWAWWMSPLFRIPPRGYRRATDDSRNSKV